MTGSIKNKIWAGSAFLFFLVMLSGGLSLYFIIKFRLESKNLLEANYQSIEYAQKIRQGLDSIRQGNRIFIDSLDETLKKQEVNVTEAGEQAATRFLRQSFEKVRGGNPAGYAEAGLGLQHITSINLQAIRNKTQKSERAADDAMTFLITLVSFVFIIGLTFVVNFPSVITRPIQKLTTAIREIGLKNYAHRIRIDSKDEFGALAGAFNDMAERLEKFENSNLNQIIFEKSRAEAVINSLKDASIGIDKSNVVLFANNQALQLLNLSAGEIVGKDVDEVKKHNDLFRFLLAENGNVPFKIVVDNRENYFIKETINISEDGSGNKVIILRNITSFKELDVAKNNFIATISHELKTPLASSDLSLKLLADNRIGELTGDQRDLVQNLRNDNQRMLRILSELLNMSQVEAGKIIMNMQTVSPHRIADDAIETITAAAKDKALTISKSYESFSDVLADAEKTGWVLNNFLANAVRHSPKNSTITVALRELENDIEFVVIDRGAGIAAEYLPRVFERFFRVPGSQPGGTGLGLAISKEFIEAEGGNILVSSEVGSGSAFSFRLPKAK